MPETAPEFRHCSISRRKDTLVRSGGLRELREKPRNLLRAGGFVVRLCVEFKMERPLLPIMVFIAQNVGSTGSGRRGRQVMTDQEIKTQVENALDREPSVDASDVGVSVEGGVVTLRGNVQVLPRQGHC